MQTVTIVWEDRKAKSFEVVVKNKNDAALLVWLAEQSPDVIVAF